MATKRSIYNGVMVLILLVLTQSYPIQMSLLVEWATDGVDMSSLGLRWAG